MAETINIAKLAEYISEDIFSAFGWHISGPPNMSLTCSMPTVHKKKSHPTDVVFVYQDPYSLELVHLLTDLKSYKATSLESFAIQDAMEALALAVDCAKSNPEWKRHYLEEPADPEIQGMLFVYNHDQQYDAEFVNEVASVSEEVTAPKGVRINVIGPSDIWYLHDLRNDLDLLAGRKKIPVDDDARGFYYPSHARKLLTQKEFGNALTIEAVVGKYQLFTYKLSDGKRGMLVYYKGEGRSPAEFTLLFDMLRIYGVLDRSDEISIRLSRGHKEASMNFNKAKTTYSESQSQGVPYVLKKVTFDTVQNARPRISEYVLVRE